MGRPINHRYIGIPWQDRIVLKPLVQVNGLQERAWILGQTGSNKYFCQTVTSKYRGIFVLANGLNQNHDMILHWRTVDNSHNGYVARLTNLTLRDFSNRRWLWTIDSTWLVYQQMSGAYIESNSTN